jgi:hypothetical protein
MSSARSVTGVEQPSYRGENTETRPLAMPGRQPVTGDYSHQLETAEFQADVTFYCVQYPYWLFPYNAPIFNVVQQQGAGIYHHQSNLGIVGRPRGINDWNTVLQTPYGVLPDELQ